jgi:hypothetical protein
MSQAYTADIRSLRQIGERGARAVEQKRERMKDK